MKSQNDYSCAFVAKLPTPHNLQVRTLYEPFTNTRDAVLYSPDHMAIIGIDAITPMTLTGASALNELIKQEQPFVKDTNLTFIVVSESDPESNDGVLMMVPKTPYNIRPYDEIVDVSTLIVYSSETGVIHQVGTTIDEAEEFVLNAQKNLGISNLEIRPNVSFTQLKHETPADIIGCSIALVHNCSLMAYNNPVYDGPQWRVFFNSGHRCTTQTILGNDKDSAVETFEAQTGFAVSYIAQC